MKRLLLIIVFGMLVSMSLVHATAYQNFQCKMVDGPEIITNTTGRLMEVEWPSRNFPTIQSAIDSLANGGTLKLKEGVFKVNAPIVIRDKTVHIKGEGSGCKNLNNKIRKISLNKLVKTDLIKKLYKKSLVRNRAKGTVLIGPIADRVVDSNRVRPIFSYENGGGSLEGVKLVGADVGIMGKDVDGSSKSLKVKDACITDTGRGILWKASSSFQVEDTVIKNISWNAISLSPDIRTYLGLHIMKNVFTFDVKNFCIYTENAFAFIEGASLINCQKGGIASYQSAMWINDNDIINPHAAGMFLESSYAEIIDDVIFNSKSVGGILGDGIVLWDNTYTSLMDNNHIYNSDRAAMSNFGSYAALSSNLFSCQSFDLEGEPYHNKTFTFDDLGGNKCGCPGADSTCVVVSASLQPPPPVGGIE